MMDPQVVTVSTTLAQMFLTGVLAWTVYRSTSRIARLDFSRSLRETWIGIDNLALSDTEILLAADSLLTQRKGRDRTTFARKRWFILAYLNPIATAFQGVKEGIYAGRQKDEMLAGVRSQLVVLLADEDAYWVTQNHGHEDSFQRFCTEIRQALVSVPSSAPNPLEGAEPGSLDR
jgi:hypothetical protein